MKKIIYQGTILNMSFDISDILREHYTGNSIDRCIGLTEGGEIQFDYHNDRAFGNRVLLQLFDTEGGWPFGDWGNIESKSHWEKILSDFAEEQSDYFAEKILNQDDYEVIFLED